MNVSNDVPFPLTIRFEDGSEERFESISDLEMNLEFFDSENSPGCLVLDSADREVHLFVNEKLELETLELKN